MKQRLSHPLSGANPVTLLRLLSRQGAIPPRAWPQVFLALLVSVLRLPISFLEKAWVGLKRDKFDPIDPPIFIVGHWRSGTTHLYNVMSRGENFAFVSPFATALPWDFLLLGRGLKRFLTRALPKDRYIDNIPVEADSPQEDEIAIANMTPLSFYHALYFPKHFKRNFDEGLYFDNVDPTEVGEWRRLARYFFLKLAMEFGAKRVLIKNPVYTARIALLRAMYPNAKFIHIYRNPYKVFFSMRNFYDKLFQQFALQPHEQIDIDTHIFETYDRMMRRYFRDTADMKADQLVDIRFDDFQADPIGELKRVYDAFGLSGFDADKARYADYLESVSNYKKNSYSYPEDDLKMIEARWKHHLDRWGFKRPETD